MKKIEAYESVWHAISASPHEATSMQAKSELMMQIISFIKTKKLIQQELAKCCGVTQPRMNNLLRGRISNFSLDALVNIATSLGLRVHIEVQAA